MRDTHTGYGKIVSFLVVIALVISGLGIFDTGTVKAEIIPDENPVAGNLTQTFLTISNLVADKPVVHIAEDTILYMEIQNTGGSTGDDNYTSCISQARADTADLLASTNRQSAKVMLGKAIDELDAALISVEDNQRLASLENIKKAITFLDNAGKMSVDTSDVISDLATGTIAKIATVINEATMNFGSEHPDVKDAKVIYNNAFSKFESGKYAAAFNLFKAAFETGLGAYECDVRVTVIDFIPDDYEAEIGILALESLKAESAGGGNILWHPTELGLHYIKVSIIGEYMVYSSPGTLVESPPAIMSVGFPVTPYLGPPEKWGGPDPDFPSIIDPTVEPIRTRENIEIHVYDDLVIKPGATLILNEQVTLVMMEPQKAEFSILVEQDATFEINGGAQTSYVYASSYSLTYPFINRGSIVFNGANVLNTFGDISDPLNTGGIRNIEGGSCILNNCQIVNPETHGVYVDSDSSLTVKGTDSLIGSLAPAMNGIQEGHGIFVNGATPVIEDITVQNQKQDGIHIEYSMSAAPIQATDLHNYGPSGHDYRLTYGLDPSTRPIVSTGNGAIYVVYRYKVFDGMDSIFFKTSMDQGALWSEEMEIASSADIQNIDFAADGEHLALVWEAFDDVTASTSMCIIYSDDGGATWTTPYLIPNGYWPSIAVAESRIYLAYRLITFAGPDFYKTIQLKYGDDGVLDEQWEFVNPDPTIGEFGGIPKVAAGGGIVHVVVADLTISTPYIYYWQSLDDGATWSDFADIGTWTYSGSPTWDFTDYFSLDAEGSQVSLVWAGYNTGNYEIYGTFSSDSGMNWAPYPAIQLTTSTGDSICPEIFVEPSGDSMIVYQSDRDGTDRIFMQSVDSSGISIGVEICMTPDTTGAALPSVSIDGLGNSYLTWSDVRSGNDEIYVKQVQQLVVTRTDVENNKNGIRIISSSGGIINECTIIGNSDYGIYLESSSGIALSENQVEESEMAGIGLGNVCHMGAWLPIYMNTIYNNRMGIEAIGSYVNVVGGLIEGNSRFGVGPGSPVGPHSGIHAISSAISVVGVAFLNNRGSIALMDLSVGYIEGCTIYETGLPSYPGAEYYPRSAGIYLDDSIATVVGNEFTECGPGMKATSNAQVWIYSNSFRGGGGYDTGLPNDLVGIWVEDNSAAEIMDNQFIDMRKSVYLGSSMATIIGNVIEGGKIGIESRDSTPIIESNIISDCTEWAIASYYQEPSNPGIDLLNDNDLTGCANQVAHYWSLTVIVTTLPWGIPVEGAYVEVTHSGMLWAEGYTEENGEIMFDVMDYRYVGGTMDEMNPYDLYILLNPFGSEYIIINNIDIHSNTETLVEFP